MMAKATGVGGIFLRAKDPEALYSWYEKHLGISRTSYGAFAFEGEEAQGVTLVDLFPAANEVFWARGKGGDAQFPRRRSGCDLEAPG